MTLLLTATALLAIAPAANAQLTRKTAAYLSVNPKLLGIGQEMTVNIWVLPSPADPHFAWFAEGFTGFTVTFTRPDGSKDSFMPVDGSGGLEPGVSEMIGAIWFLYKPNQIGTWTVQFSFPGQTFTSPDGASVLYPAANSPVTTFTVQQDLVQIGLPPVALPTGYWQRPINSDNREWYQISGDWLQTDYDQGDSCFNPYSKGPNSAHIIWKQEVSQGGIIGGDWGSISYGDGGGDPPIILNGKVYYNMPGGVFRCVDLRTGELKYQTTGSITLAHHLRAATRDPTRGTPETQGADVTPSLWGLGSTSWTRYDPLTGTLLQTITNVPRPLAHDYGGAGTFTVLWALPGDTVCYIVRQGGFNTTIPYRLAQNELIKWDYNKVTGNNWVTGIVWNVSLKNPDGTGPGEGQRGSAIYVTGNYGVVSTTGQDDIYGYDLTTGTRLWSKTLDFLQMGWYSASSMGTWYAFDSVTMTLHYLDIKTGNELWATHIGKYPWGSFINNPRAYAYGLLYVGCPDGYIYALDTATGAIKWEFFFGATTETVFGAWYSYLDAVIADGKLYQGTSEHTPTQPRIRGNYLAAIDALTGKSIWTISGALEAKAVAEGYVIGVSENDGLMYCLGKGQTATTISAPQTAVAKGTSLLLSGTVMDMSPAQPNTPAISDDSMSGWMDYLHMQKPMPTNVQGVSISLAAIGPDGSTSDIGTVTSDAGGLFKKMWTPPASGEYTIVATFAGSESYWSSMAETALGVTAASEASASPSPTGSAAPTGAEAAPMALYIGVASIIIVAIIVAAALMLRRRK